MHDVLLVDVYQFKVPALWIAVVAEEARHQGVVVVESAGNDRHAAVNQALRLGGDVVGPQADVMNGRRGCRPILRTAELTFPPLIAIPGSHS